jgi:hypothetical protein
MADQEDIDEVKDMLGPNAEAEGWDDNKIGDLLDEGQRPHQIAKSYWETRMAKTAHLADVAESGSSRKLSQISTNAVALAAYHRGADAAVDPANQPASFCRPIDRV